MLLVCDVSVPDKLYLGSKTALDAVNSYDFFQRGALFDDLLNILRVRLGLL